MQATPIETIRNLYARLSMDDQLSIMSDLIECGGDLSRSDDFCDEIFPVAAVFVKAFPSLQVAAQPFCYGDVA